MDPLLERLPLCPGSMLEGDGAVHHASLKLGCLKMKHECASGTGSCRVTCCESQEEGASRAA